MSFTPPPAVIQWGWKLVGLGALSLIVGWVFVTSPTRFTQFVLAALALGVSVGCYLLAYRVRGQGLHRIPLIFTLHACLITFLYRMWLGLFGGGGARGSAPFVISHWGSRVVNLAALIALVLWMRASYLSSTGRGGR